jgi:hypothetical protein
MFKTIYKIIDIETIIVEIWTYLVSILRGGKRIVCMAAEFLCYTFVRTYFYSHISTQHQSKLDG